MKKYIMLVIATMSASAFGGGNHPQDSVQINGLDKVACVKLLLENTISQNKLPRPVGELSMIRKKSKWPFWGVTYQYSYSSEAGAYEGKMFPIVIQNDSLETTTCYYLNSDCTGSLSMRLWEKSTGNIRYQINAIEDDNECSDTGDFG